jgi:hypothetical protein
LGDFPVVVRSDFDLTAFLEFAFLPYHFATHFLVKVGFKAVWIIGALGALHLALSRFDLAFKR